MISPRLRSGVSRVGDAALWIAAVLGVASLVLGLATVVAGVQPLIFRSGSMGPAIEAGALAIARTVPADEVAVGDIVSVSDAEGTRVTHRVVGIDEAEGEQVSLTLKGDANRSPDADPYVVTEVDRVFVDAPYLGFVAQWTASPWALFAAGIAVAYLVSLLWRRPASRDGRSAATAVGVLAALGLGAGALAPVPTTEAYFGDSSTFEAGTIQAHQVRIFDWGTPPCTTNADGSVTLRYVVTSPRYDMAWFRAPKGSAMSTSPFLTVTPSNSAVGSAVSSTITRSALADGQSLANGTYVISGRSKLKGAATTPWLSAAERNTEVTVDASTVRCGDINLPPTLSVTSPQDGVTYPSTTAIDIAVGIACSGLRSPCGTATDANGIHSVEYRLQRSSWFSTQCWNPDAFFGAGFYFTGCGDWRDAVTSPSTPTTSGSSVNWRVPLGFGGPGTTFSQSGEYTLYLRITDNASPRVVTERTIRFTVR